MLSWLLLFLCILLNVPDLPKKSSGYIFLQIHYFHVLRYKEGLKKQVALINII